MIRDMTELSASLRYISRWSDLLEGLRHQAAATDSTLLPTTSAGPLAEIRRVVAEAQEFVEGLAQDASNKTGADYHLPVPEERQKVA